MQSSARARRAMLEALSDEQFVTQTRAALGTMITDPAQLEKVA